MRLVCVLAISVFCLGADKDAFTPEQRKYWAFQPVAHPQAPAVKHKEWAVNAIDAFLVQKLEAKGLGFSPAADKVALLRRVTFDLIGLPPTPEEVDAFIADKSPHAYEKVVDRLLASPHYGERWARHWLDLARYAESEGFKADETRPNAWRYRDYVIQSFNQNKPYDRFVKEQIAGDEMWPNDPWARVATGFNRHYPDESNARNLWQRRQEILNDITDTVGSTFLGLTYGCARCHTHKFDPILHADYYRLQAFFANTAADDSIPMASPAELSQYRSKKANWEEQTKSIREQISVLLAPKKEALRKDYFEKYPPEIQALLVKPWSERNPLEGQMFHKAQAYLHFDDETAAKSIKGDEKAKYLALLGELKKFAILDPGETPVGIGMKDLGPSAPATHILQVGAYDAPLDEVKPGFLSILDPKPAIFVPSPDGNSTGRRTSLANWIASSENPLTARVMVNRIWFHHFGQGIAPDPSDFGAMGGRPSHPELLDWLASEFVRSGWDIKAMQKLIVMSKAYQQSSAFNAAAAKEDPRNKLLWRFSRERLEGEVIRDAALSVAGLLNEKMGGPSIFPELPAGAGRPRGGWALSEAEERNRRSVYIFVRRNSRYPMLEEFDMPDTHESCGRRNKTITAPQAMSMLNGQVSLEWAEAFAGRLFLDAGADANRQIDMAFRLAFGRHPDGFEKDTVQTFFQTQRQLLTDRTIAGEKLALPKAMPAGYDPVQAATLVDFCQMLLNSNEFVYQN